jgi:hypothetical protein
MNITDPECISRRWLHEVEATQIYILPKINITEDAVKIISYINFKKQGLEVHGEGDLCCLACMHLSLNENIEMPPFLVCSRDYSADDRGPFCVTDMRNSLNDTTPLTAVKLLHALTSVLFCAVSVAAD